MAMPERKYMFVEMPDQTVTIEFNGFCTVKLTTTKGDPNTLRVEVKGHDDRATIMLDQDVELPEPDSETEDDEDDYDPRDPGTDFKAGPLPPMSPD